ncbi:dabb-domain-containing protein [Aspergillus sclerotiicarbonarius CBS 121057]|uniref:Dabb-domain-containing protein n=1 Tax=Aspergillus sclerotiicarbonarius (strain CBS 121057 / IBT 28362) TaxID=1448318 RepID=A0A319ES49_ASPSB|nr:dabb-domain-containing protein [Aspergillus sclerotiicarbonarius CBS 121057]
MITHIVQFQFKSSTSTEKIQEACAHLVSLKEKCLHPTTQQPYIRSFKAGKQDSPEGMNNGITHVFVMQFENNQDREYYLTKDPAHIGFVKSIDGLVEKIQVVDFTEGVF